MLIGLNGKLQSGKDTVFGIIKESFPDAERLSFAAKLKESLAGSIGVTVEELEEIKHNGDITIEWGPMDNSILNRILGRELHRKYRRTFTGRKLQQWYGTEGHRASFGEDFWVNQVFPAGFDHGSRLCVVTDMRFPNEIQRVRELGGFCVYVSREEAEKNGDSHDSEQDIPLDQFDWVLDNNGTLDDLRARVAIMVPTLIATYLGRSSQRKVSVSANVITG